MKIVEHIVWHDGEKVGWIDGTHIRSQASGAKLGYFQGNDIFNDASQKVAYIKDNALHFENGNASVSLDHINGEIEGTDPIAAKCAVHVLLED